MSSLLYKSLKQKRMLPRQKSYQYKNNQVPLSGRAIALIIWGGGGIGKSHAIKRALTFDDMLASAVISEL
jgi:hypothetical protein